MKQDWEVIRSILLRLEQAPAANAYLNAEAIAEYPEQEVAYNMRLLSQADFIKAEFIESSTGDGAIAAAMANHMTNRGHDLLDTIRNDTVWAKIKEKFKSKGLEMTFDLVLTVGKKVMEEFLS